MAGRKLPIVAPADVHGRYHRARHAVFALLIALWAVLPWVRLAGHPAIFLDVERRRFFFFGTTFNSQDAWLLFFLATGIGFGLVFMTAIAGRVFCGWMCPHTVFLEAVYRRIERWIEGPRERRLRAASAPWGAAKIARKVAVHSAYLLASYVIAHIVLSYFVSLPKMFEMVRTRPAEHPEAFAWAFGLTAILYFDLAHFRERLCTSFCPYGRLQGVLVDEDSLMVGYDTRRGEPRGKATAKDRGDCVDCKRCVVVCPTGIDIRQGPQLECIACTACIDACDDVMERLGRAPGLVRYDSTRGLAGARRRFWRPRIVLYTALGLVGLAAATTAAKSRSDFEAVLLRAPGAPYVVTPDSVYNAFDLHLVNKRGTRERFRIGVDAGTDVTAQVEPAEVELEPLSGTHVAVALRMPVERCRGDFRFRIRVERESGREMREVQATFLGGGR
ncbi:cytochrome c oxidase accessory protein CcoG [Pendulispora brunnea]|uniref:Cytochrome c oxidase accessory protein CcoG n=1 Tax=Pendulispora brunnea TaxID=2905690 RepID=A0ABZ2K0T5_9BACT